MGKSFSDFENIISEVYDTMRLYAVSYCEESNRLIGLRFFVADQANPDVRTGLGAHGITDQTGTCESATLPTMNFTAGRIFYANST